MRLRASMLPLQDHKAAKSGELGLNPCLSVLGSLLIETPRCFVLKKSLLFVPPT